MKLSILELKVCANPLTPLSIWGFLLLLNPELGIPASVDTGLFILLLLCFLWYLLIGCIVTQCVAFFILTKYFTLYNAIQKPSILVYWISFSVAKTVFVKYKMLFSILYVNLASLPFCLFF